MCWRCVTSIPAATTMRAMRLPASTAFRPDSASAYLLAARMLLRREYPAGREGVSQKALELDPQIPLAHMLLGEIALAGQNLDVAIAELEKERARNPLYGGLYDRLGDAYIARRTVPAG